MTTLASWVGVDSRGASSLYIVSDSRITWFLGPERKIVDTWDNGRKTFASQTSPVILGYCGDVLLPTQTIGQIIAQIDTGAVQLDGQDPKDRLNWITSSLETSCATYPKSAGRSFSLVYGGRQGSGMTATFFAFAVEFKDGIALPPVHLEIPKSSAPLKYNDGKEQVAFGSGRDGFSNHWVKWLNSDVGGTSRSVFSAFADHISGGGDPCTGGPPQLVGVYRVGPAKTFGIVWNSRRYVGGMEATDVSDKKRINWHNDLFELCNPTTMQRRETAQPQPRPMRI